MYNACKAMKLLIITWVHICISFNKLIWLMQKIEKIDILSLIFMPCTWNKSPGAKKGSDEWQCDNFTNIFWVKCTFTSLKNRHAVIFFSRTKSILPSDFLKVSLFQNLLLVSSFGPKYQRKIWQISALEFEKWWNQQNKGTFL